MATSAPALKARPADRNAAGGRPWWAPRGLPSHHRSSCFLHSSLLQRTESRGLPTPSRAPGPTGQGRAASTGSRTLGIRLSSLGTPPPLLLPPLEPDCRQPTRWPGLPSSQRSPVGRGTCPVCPRTVGLLFQPGDSLWILVTTRAGGGQPGGPAARPRAACSLPTRAALILAPCCCGGHVSALPTHSGQLRAEFCQ